MKEPPAFDSRWATFVSRWHAFASRRAVILNAVLFTIGVVAAIDIASLGVDADWLRLFDHDDPELRLFLATGTPEANMHAVYVRVGAGIQEHIPEIAILLRAHPDVARSGSNRLHRRPQVATPGSLSQSPRIPPLSVTRRREVIVDLRAALRDYGLQDSLTGPEAVMARYSDLVSRDLLRSSLIAAGLVTAVVFLFVDVSGAVVIGLLYEAVGLLFALAIHRRLFGSLNMISSAVPGILMGLGIDFVIHTVLAVDREEGSAEPGLSVYAKVSRPMTWGVATTATGFGALAAMGPRGMVQVGVLGGIGVLTVFAVIYLFLPPTLTRLSRAGRLRPGPRPLLARSRTLARMLPTSRRATAMVRGAVICAVLVLCAFVWRLEWDTQLSANYYPDMPESALMDELGDDVGVYPALLHLTLWTDDSRVLLSLARASRNAFVLVPHTLRTRVDSETNSRVVSVQMMPTEDPFIPENLAHLQEWLGEHLSDYGHFELTGEVILTEHLSALIRRAMLRAYGIMVLALTVTLTVMFRRIRFVMAPVVVLVVATTCTLGALALVGSPLNVFSITVFPLLMGIGVDDCLYLADAIHRGRKIRHEKRLVKALAMTTLTTVAGYSALMAAANQGLVAMGRTAVLGLILVFLCSLYLVPWMLGLGPRVGSG